MRYQRPTVSEDYATGADERRLWQGRRRAHPSHPGLGFARRRDIDDGRSQAAAPRCGGRSYDRTGDERYEDGLQRFEHGQPGGRWELDEGAVQFGEPTSHAGRGPRDYQRSDARIREDVCEWLTQADDVDASDIAVAVDGGVVTLEGTVDSRDARRRAEDIAAAVAGVRDVQNRLQAPRQSRGVLLL